MLSTTKQRIKTARNNRQVSQETPPPAGSPQEAVEAFEIIGFSIPMTYRQIEGLIRTTLQWREE